MFSTARTLGIFLLIFGYFGFAPSVQPSLGDDIVKTTKDGDNEMEATKTAVALIKKLIEADPRLSTDDTRITHFRCPIRTEFRNPDNTSIGAAFIVQRCQDRVTIVACNDNTLPFAYMRNGFFAGFDHSDPGTLLVRNRGCPEAFVASQRKPGSALCVVGFNSFLEQPNIDINFGGLLKAALAKLKSAEIKPNGTTIEIRTEHAVVVIELFQGNDNHPFPIKSLTFVGVDGSSLALGPADNDPDPAKVLREVNEEGLITAKLRVKTAVHDDLGRVRLIVPDHFADGKEENDAAQKLRSLFDGKSQRDK